MLEYECEECTTHHLLYTDKQYIHTQSDSTHYKKMCSA